MVKSEHGNLIRRIFGDIVLFACGGILVYITYRFVTWMNELVIDSVSINKEQKNMFLYWIGMINGAINFVIVQIFNFFVEIIVDWENHRYEERRLNSLIMKKVIFTLYAYFFTLVAQTFTRDFEILSNQVSSNFIIAMALNYGVAIGIPALKYLKKRYYMWKCGCFCKRTKSKIDDFKRKMMYRLSDGLNDAEDNIEFDSVFDSMLLTEEQRAKIEKNRAKRIKSALKNSSSKSISVHPTGRGRREESPYDSELPPLKLNRRNNQPRNTQVRRIDQNLKHNNPSFAINQENNIRRRLGEGKNNI